MEPRDIILTVNGVNVTSAQDALTRIANAKPGDRIRITGLRGSQEFSSEVLVSERPRGPAG
jgi:S1-C subfamily serine protease